MKNFETPLTLVVCWFGVYCQAMLQRGTNRSCTTFICPYGTVCTQKITYCETSPCPQRQPICQVLKERRLETCDAMTCPQGTACKQKTEHCNRQGCYQPPAICETVLRSSLAQEPLLCPPGFTTDYIGGTTVPCFNSRYCEVRSICLKAGNSGRFICCSRNTRHSNIGLRTANTGYGNAGSYAANQREIEVIQVRPPEVEVRHREQEHIKVQIVHEIPSAQTPHCPQGFIPDTFRGRTVTCTNIRQCAPRSICALSGINGRSICCSRNPHLDIMPEVNRRTRQRPVGYGNARHRNFPVDGIRDHSVNNRNTHNAVKHQDNYGQSPHNNTPGRNGNTRIPPMRYSRTHRHDSPVNNGNVHRQPVIFRNIPSRTIPIDNVKIRRHIMNYGNTQQRTSPRNTRHQTVSFSDTQHRPVNYADAGQRIFNFKNTPNKLMHIGNTRQRVTLTPVQQQGGCPAGYHTESIGGQFVSCVSSTQCSKGSICQSTGLFKGAICCRKTVVIRKTNFCPLPSRQIQADCRQSCTSDINCFGRMKCCFNGCGKSCLNPIIT